MKTSRHARHSCRHTALAHGLLLALSLGLGSAAAAPVATHAGQALMRLQASDDAPARADVDALANDWRETQRERLAPPLPQGSPIVTNCNDSGPGSLRDVIAGAASGDAIDLGTVACSSITLTTGALVVTQPSLTLQGPPGGLVIGADDQTEVIVHVGNGSLTLNHLGIEHGSKYMDAAQAADARGGCIASAGVVVLQSSSVTHCVAAALGQDRTARGGAVFATGGVIVISSLVGGGRTLSPADSAGGLISSPGSVSLIDSVITQGYAEAGSGDARGGGVDAGGEFIAMYSSFLQNVAITEAYTGSGGGAYAVGDVHIASSSFALNGSMTGGAVAMRGAGHQRTISNSTFAGNMGPGAAGILAAGSDLRIANSTIAYNTNSLPGAGAGLFAEGVAIDLESSLLAWNGDLDASTYADTEGSGTLTGSRNLIHSSHLAPPAGTIENVDPRIVPIILDDVHVLIALRPGSAAINAGDNPDLLTFDQRGTGHPRQLGTATDIGAFEFDIDDLMFAGGFD